EKDRLDRTVARGAGRALRRGRRCRGRRLVCRRRGRRERWRRQAGVLLAELLERAQRVLAAGHAQVQPPLGLEKQRVGVVLAGVAALAAILLAHRGHHAPAQRPTVGELHALADRQRLVVPGRLAVVAVVERALGGGRDARHEFRALLGRQRRNAATVEAEIPG